jgi:hypothetical protein
MILVAGFCFGIYQFNAQQRENQARSEAAREMEVAQFYVKTVGSELTDFYYPIRLRLEMDSNLTRRLKEIKDKDDQMDLWREIDESTLLPNLDEICKIILSHADTLTKDPQLRDAAFRFMNEVSIQRSLKIIEKRNRHAPAVDTAWPEGFRVLIKDRATTLQQVYDKCSQTPSLYSGNQR